MIVTEKDAQAKRCPLPMGTMNDSRTQNHCIGSGCMAWDWEDPEDEVRGVDLSTESFTEPEIEAFTPPEGEGWEARNKPYQPEGYGRRWRLHFYRPAGARRRGFCGLACRADGLVTLP